jgi:hypothetical protein
MACDDEADAMEPPGAELADIPPGMVSRPADEAGARPLPAACR